MLFMPCVCHNFPSGKGLISWLSFVMFGCVFVTFPCGILGQVWFLIVLIPDLCHLSYINSLCMGPQDHYKHRGHYCGNFCPDNKQV